jgi:branched-chain amino acid transport system substrate-binding protein
MAVAEKYKMIYVSMGGHMKSFQQGYKYSIGGPPLMGEWWYEGIWQWLESLPADQRPKTMAIFTMNNLVGMAVKGSTTEGAKRLSIKVVVDELYDLPLATAEPLVAKAKAANAEIMVANSLFPDGVAITKAMKALDYNPKLYLEGVGTLIPGWTKELGSDGNYALSGTPMHSSLPFPGMKELNEIAKKRFNEPVAPQYFLFGYAWMQTLQRGVEGAKSLDQDAIAKYLRSNEISTIAGKFKFDDKGLPSPYNYATQVINGKPELVWPKDVKTADIVSPKPAWGK